MTNDRALIGRFVIPGTNLIINVQQESYRGRGSYTRMTHTLKCIVPLKTSRKRDSNERTIRDNGHFLLIPINIALTCAKGKRTNDFVVYDVATTLKNIARCNIPCALVSRFIFFRRYF